MVDVNESISIQNILLRGCVLKNTEGVIGAVISTGTDTKVEYGVEKKKWWSVKVDYLIDMKLIYIEFQSEDSYVNETY